MQILQDEGGLAQQNFWDITLESSWWSELFFSSSVCTKLVSLTAKVKLSKAQPHDAPNTNKRYQGKPKIGPWPKKSESSSSLAGKEALANKTFETGLPPALHNKDLPFTMGKLQVCVRTFLCSEKISECYSFKQHYFRGGVTTTITSTINVPCLCQMALLAGGRTCSSRTTFTFVEHQKAKVLGFYNNENVDNLFAFKSFKPLLLDERATWLYLKFIADFFVCGQNKLFVITIQEKEPL